MILSGEYNAGVKRKQICGILHLIRSIFLEGTVQVVIFSLLEAQVFGQHSFYIMVI